MLFRSISANIVQESMLLVNSTVPKYFNERGYIYTYRNQKIHNKNVADKVFSEMVKTYDGNIPDKEYQKMVNILSNSYLNAYYSIENLGHEGLCYNYVNYVTIHNPSPKEKTGETKAVPEDSRRGKGMHSFDIKTKIYYGDGALDRLTQIPYKKVMIITDPFVVQSGMVMMITSRLDEAKIEFEVFKDVVPDPPIDKVVAGVKAVMDYKPEAIVEWAAVLPLIPPKRSVSLLPG